MISKEKQKKLLKNSAECRNCHSVLVSYHRHDFTVCKCWKNAEDNQGIFIDGGLDYVRRGGKLENIIDRCEYKDE